MNPQRLPIELVDITAEADAIDDCFSSALSEGDVRKMRHCVTRLVHNHRRVVHVESELCEEVALLVERVVALEAARV